MNTHIELFKHAIPLTIREGVVSISESETVQSLQTTTETRTVDVSTPGRTVFIPGGVGYGSDGQAIYSYGQSTYLPGSHESRQVSVPSVTTVATERGVIKVRLQNDLVDYPIEADDQLTIKQFEVGDKVIVIALAAERFRPLAIVNLLDRDRVYIINKTWRERMCPILEEITNLKVPEAPDQADFTHTPELDGLFAEKSRLESANRATYGVSAASRLQSFLTWLGLVFAGLVIGWLTQSAWVALAAGLAGWIAWSLLFSTKSMTKRRRKLNDARISAIDRKTSAAYDEADERYREALEDWNRRLKQFGVKNREAAQAWRDFVLQIAKDWPTETGS